MRIRRKNESVIEQIQFHSSTMQKNAKPIFRLLQKLETLRSATLIIGNKCLDLKQDITSKFIRLI